MAHIHKNPSWIDSRLFYYNKLDELPDSLFTEIMDGLAKFKSNEPVVSVVIPALNEEVSILRTLHSLSQNKTSYPTEILVVNNNSTDRTQEVLDRLQVRSFFQARPGWGPARQMGQEKARGKYILMADADCFYPPGWIQRMTSELEKEGVTCVYGGYKFLASRGRSRWKYFVYESLRHVIAEVRDIRRPWFNCVGMCMGYVRELGLKIGFIDRKIPGEDGRMCYELSRLGKIVRLHANEVVVWTFPRTLEKDRNLMYSVINRVLIEAVRFGSYFRKEVAHDTHTSENFRPPNLKYFPKGLAPRRQKEPMK
jgi:glycosyltransferase involved in cell wall biosynthesis